MNATIKHTGMFLEITRQQLSQESDFLMDFLVQDYTFVKDPHPWDWQSASPISALRMRNYRNSGDRRYDPNQIVHHLNRESSLRGIVKS